LFLKNLNVLSEALYENSSTNLLLVFIEKSKVPKSKAVNVHAKRGLYLFGN